MLPTSYLQTSFILFGLFLTGCAGDLPPGTGGTSRASSTNIQLPNSPPVTQTIPGSTPLPSAGTSTSGSSADLTSAISNFYNVSLGRVPDSGGLSYYLSQAQGGRALSEIGIEIANSPEAKIRQVYLTHLLREPDLAGMNYWLRDFALGQSLEQISYNIRKASECKVSCL